MSVKLTPKQIEEFKASFLEQKEVILNEYREKHKNSSEVDFDGDETDIVQGNMISSIEDKLSMRDADRLCKIQGALQRISSGTFGTCEECEGPIGKARLLARPEAELCIECAEKAEREAKHFANLKTV